MAQYVSIKRSKNLRFKLISLMYLIFLVLTVIQIPISWLKVSPTIKSYIEKPKVTFHDEALISFSKNLNVIDSNFKLALGFDPQTGKIPEPNSYSITDKFFVEGPDGKDLYNNILALNNWVNQLPATDPRKALFGSLFQADLENGIDVKNEKKWLDYRWKHVPATLALNLMEEINLRTKLLNKGPVEDVEEVKEPSFTLMTNYSTMRVGDEATLSSKGDNIVEVNVERDGRKSNNFSLEGNTLKFKPLVAGLYIINAKGTEKSESLTIQVLPSGFPKKEALPFRVCYTGVEYEQRIPLNKQSVKLFCSADPNAYINTQSEIITFMPRKEGWCSIRLNTGEGIVFWDSVFVKPLPDPIFQIKEIPSLSISKKRLLQLNQVEVVAMHPSFKEKVFNIQSFQLKWVGSEQLTEKISGNQIPIKDKTIENLQYLIIYDIEVKMGLEKKKFEQPIIIQIN